MLERERQTVSEWPSLDELVHRTADGWKLVALEWEREALARRGPPAHAPVEIPYGFRASEDGYHMVDEPAERQVLMIVLNSIVDDRPLSQAASDLNRAGFSTRQGRQWSPASVFDLLPRLIEAGPAIFASPDWIAQREKRARA
jgi:hypothetical protein